MQVSAVGPDAPAGPLVATVVSTNHASSETAHAARTAAKAVRGPCRVRRPLIPLSRQVAYSVILLLLPLDRNVRASGCAGLLGGEMAPDNVGSVERTGHGHPVAQRSSLAQFRSERGAAHATTAGLVLGAALILCGAASTFQASPVEAVSPGWGVSAQYSVNNFLEAVSCGSTSDCVAI